MNATAEFDAGPLTWVISEIDLALESAVAALDQFSASAASGSADSTQIRFCRTHLHQVHGALTIVGMDGVTQFAEALEGLLEVIETEARPAGDYSIGLVRRALEAIGLYLRGVIGGQANQPLRLLPLYQEIQAERGVQRHSAVDLFFPDLSLRPPRQSTQAGKLSNADYSALLRRERGRFQRGLLAWLRTQKGRNGIEEMRTAVRHIEETQGNSAARAFWWVAGGLLTALEKGKLPGDASVKLLCARIDLQIRRLLEGSKNVAERLMRDTLYLVVGAKSDDALVKQIKETYHLDTFLPIADDSIVPDAAQAAVSRLREVISVLEEAWNKFCAGSASSLPVFKENADILSGLIEKTGHTDYRRLAQAIVAVANWLVKMPERHSDALAMELATAILLADSAQKNYPHLGGDFAHQVDVTVERVHACIAGHPLQAGSEIPLLDEMSRRAQEKLLVGQVAKEIQSNLILIEQGLDGFFRDAEKHSELAALEKPFRQIIGALTMLRQEGATAAAQDCLETVLRFAAPDYLPAEGEFEQLASQLSMLGFFVEAMPRGVADFASFVRQMQAPSRDDADSAPEDEDDSIVSVEQEVVQNRRETHALLAALKEQPEDAGLREELRQNLTTLKSDADLMADTKLGEQAKAMLNVLASGADVAPQIEQAMAALKPGTAEAAQPSRETLQLSQASNEEIDAELLEIFLEEAREVMAAVVENLDRLKKNMHDSASLTIVRRSFHTLKGSGRMVGLKDLGDAAWAIEQTLNLWLRLELAADDKLIGLLDEACGVFTDWVRHLETREGHAPNPQDMVARAAALRSGTETGQGVARLVQQDAPVTTAAIAEYPMENAESFAETRLFPVMETDQDLESDPIDLAPVSPEETTDALALNLPAATDDAAFILEDPEAGPIDLAPVSPEETTDALALATPMATDDAAFILEDPEAGPIELAPVSPEETTDALALATPMASDEASFVLEEAEAEPIEFAPVSPEETTNPLALDLSVESDEAPLVVEASKPRVDPIEFAPVSPEEATDPLAFGLPVASDEALVVEEPEAEPIESAPVSPEETTDVLGLGLPMESDEAPLVVEEAGAEPIESAPVSPEETTDVLALGLPVESDEAPVALEEAEAEPIEFAPVSPEETTDVLALGLPVESDEAPVMEEQQSAEVIPMFPDARASEPARDDSAVEPEAPQRRIDISPALFAIFTEEARTYLHTLRRELPVLESEDVLPTPQVMYRAAHTLASISGAVGLPPINQLGRALEYALDRRDRAKNPGSAQALGTIRRAIGELEAMFSAWLKQQSIEVSPGLIEELDSLYPAGVVSATDEVAEETAPETPKSLPEQTPDASPGPEVSGMPPVPVAPAIAPVRDEIDTQLLPIFLEEAIELNQAIAGQLRDWRANPGNAETVRVLARQLHTLKGSARMAGAMTLGEITHALEARVDQASRAGAVSADVFDGIESTFESVRQIIERLQRGETIEPADATPDTAVAAPERSEPDASEAAAERERAEAERRRAERPRPTEAEAESEAQSQATLRVRASVVDRLVNDAGELSITRSRIEDEMRSLKGSLLDLTENVIRLRHQLREIEIQAELQIQSRTVAITDEQHAGFDPLEFDRFTRFQELTRVMAESVNDVVTVQQHLLKNLDDVNAAISAQARQNREVQQELMSMRMMPFDSLADRLYRVVRQASKELDKRINMEIKGGQIELDRSVLDKIAAPLEHMLRNSVVHGIEKRAERVARDKPEIGEISLSLKQEGNEIVLMLSDDGAGLDYGRIRQRAVAAGLLRADETADEARLGEFIFAPGFSTAEALSQIAGRGVGMDVVKTEISSLGGRVEIESRPGSGLEFRLILPLTLVVTKALLSRASGRTFAIPSSMIEQVLDLKEAGLNQIRQAGSAEWQSNRYPFSYLPHLLGERSASPRQHRKYWVLLLRSGARRIAVQVDELLGNQEIVVKNIGAQLARVIGVAGATVLGDGQVVLILNPVALSTRALAEGAARADETRYGIGQAAEPAQAAPPTVMVVDDSLTVRKITERLMAREGYQVVLARDGVEALEKLLEGVPDVMLVDIEMPRMDGFDLTRNIRADARLKHVPIIMITSRTADKHRNYAAEIGVNHYLGKPYQEEELLRLISGYLPARQPA
jgi:chemosensory pili system protein ChpA (sensor histidine kinase/response regulator)